MAALTRNPNAFEFAVCTLPGYPDLTLLRAASRAGALAILNLEAVDPADPRVTDFFGVRGGSLGVRVDAAALTRLAGSPLVDSISVLVATADAAAQHADALRAWRTPSRRLLLECTTLADAAVGSALPIDALIAKGHEAGGLVGEETTFVLVQRLRAEFDRPIWAHGGIGPETVAACLAAGCVGAMLDVQLALARESTLPDAAKTALERMGGDETLCVGTAIGRPYRIYRRPGFPVVDELIRLEQEGDPELANEPWTAGRWRDAVVSRVSWRGKRLLWPIGQDGAFAADLARRGRSVSGILELLRKSMVSHIETAKALQPLGRDAALARSHGTTYPILQGPMTRVSDTAPFAAAVAAAGGLPFLALALLRAPQVRALLAETAQLLGDRPWGVGILGFVPLELRQEQLAVVEEFRPPFAIIAGGRPDQAVSLEKQGTISYLHVPAPALLQMFLDVGARRFIFEGRECGGHVGPRTSFVLWQLAITALLRAIERGVRAEELHVIFAGGVHDARSAAMVAALAAPLARAGVKIGVLMGTAYLFTEEAVAAGAIVDGFQREALSCTETVLLETGPGHATRCVPTQFYDTFREAKRRLLAEQKVGDEIRNELETLNLGRLRVASKGIKHRGAAAAPDDRGRHVRVGPEEQRRDGMYMIGQIASLRSAVCQIADLHADVADGSVALLGDLDVAPVRVPSVRATTSISTRVAIVGMGCLLPGAPDVRTLWRNLLNKVDAIREVPPERFDIDRYFDPDRRARDRIYSRWGGFLDEAPFDPIKHGIPPNAMPSIDPFQLLTLEVVDQALRDAGYGDRPYDRERTSVILGASGGGGELGFRYGIRAGLPMYFDGVPEAALKQLPEWTEDSFAGVLLNVAAGRVANRLDLGGLNFTVDAACASSLAAVFLASRELESGTSDMVIVGGIDTVNSPFGYLCFGSAQALSPRGRCRTFDETADGIAISEGLVTLVLKRVEDAERDGDRIYAVIRAVAGSSDGKGKGLSAPRPEGQMRVLERAYAAAGFSPASVGLIEAHGTGTVAGDGAEVTALSRIFAGAGAEPQACALGSIKSMIGHTKSAAGVSGILKVALALHHSVLPPTLHVTRPNPKLREEATPFYVNTEPRSWVAPRDGQPRRAGVSSFGFGGTNFHVVLEEYDPAGSGTLPTAAVMDEWPAELFVLSAATMRDLLPVLDRVERAIASPRIPLRAVAAAVCRHAFTEAEACRVAIVATDLDDLRAKLAAARLAIQAGRTTGADPNGLYFGAAPAAAAKVAFLFPGQGSQYPGMHRELTLHFPELRHALERADAATAGRFGRPLSSFILPPPAFGQADEGRRLQQLTDTAIAQPALGAVEVGLIRLLDRFGVRPDFTAGHSYGEYVALHAAGVFAEDALFALSEARGRFMKEASGESSGTMAAVGAPADEVRAALGASDSIWVANLNAPRQTVIAGANDAIERAIATLSAAGLRARQIPVACAFHSPLVQAAQAQMAVLLATTPMQPPRVPVYSNTLAQQYGGDPGAIRSVLAEHIVSPVRFVDEIEAMYAAGARTFLEVGPKSVLTSMVREILAGRDAVVIPLDAPDRSDIRYLLGGLAQLATAGVALEYDALWQGRSIPTARLEELSALAPAALPAHVWMVSGGSARRQDQPASAPKPVGVRTVEEVTVPAILPTAAAPTPVVPPPRIVPPAAVAAPVAAHQSPSRPSVAAAPPSRVAPAPARPQVALSAQTHVRFSKGGFMQPHTPEIADRNATQHGVVMQQFQQLMSQFLQTQAVIMTTYLQGAPRGAASTLAGLPMPLPVLEPVAHPDVRVLAFPSAAPMPAPPVAAPAPVARVPVETRSVEVGHNGDHSKAFTPAPSPPVAVAPAPAPVARATAAAPPVAAEPAPPSAALTEADILKHLVALASERTGYPEEMLTADANIEADLGIDSIKRMEILAAFQEARGLGKREAFQDALERLTALKTFRESAAALAEIVGAQAVGAGA